MSSTHYSPEEIFGLETDEIYGDVHYHRERGGGYLGRGPGNMAGLLPEGPTPMGEDTTS